MSRDPWAGIARRFVRHYDSLYGQVRTLVLHRHLREHLPPPPAAVVDVGGGAGHQALPLARDGYDVTILDSSPEMLGAARSLMGQKPPSVADRVHLVEGRGEEAVELLGGGGRFAAVLCHGVLMYLDDPTTLVTILAELAAPEGVVSVVAKNARALAMRPAIERDWNVTLESFDATRQVNGLGVDTRADTVEELSEVLTESGVDPIAWYGVRLFTEGWGRDEPPADPGDAVIAAEFEASRRNPYRRLSRLFHLVGMKRPGALRPGAGAVRS